MADRARDRFWIAEPDDMLEKLRHDRERLRQGIRNLREDPREAHYATYDFLITAWQTVDEWLDDNYMLGRDRLFELAQDVANGVKHPEGADEHRPDEETYDKGDFSHDFSNDFDIDNLYLRVTEERAQAIEEAAADYGLDPQIAREKTKIPVLVLADRLIECLEQEIQGRSP